ncbi:UDP-glucose 4-epimerase GalE [Microbacterium sp. NPDC096154]|uniref:UDP-glucose 4-epimerase GalE n=1 Tax=Microbacterium sp. NPDC096154 TaxID=3155549 RepID=UPI00332612FC
MRVLLTGGAGFIGTHTALELIAAGHEPIILDDLSNADRDAVARTESLAGASIPFYEADARSEVEVRRVLQAHAPVDAVIHLASLKSVSESTSDPLRYYDVNLASAVSVLKAMLSTGVSTFVLSSSATVYGLPEQLPVTEETPTTLALSNPYGKTKRVIEEILADVVTANPAFRAISLRYFNPVGAHPSGLIGEDPLGAPTNLMPIVVDAAAGRLDAVNVYGDDYDTADGTGVRDYIHVMDLARGHVKAIENSGSGYEVFNLGTGRPVSVLELLDAFEKTNGVEVRRVIRERRPGDVAASYADPTKANRQLGWVAERSIADACADAWHRELLRSTVSS